MVDSFLKYLQFEKRYSPHTLLSYKTDLLQFSDFLKHQFETNTENADYHLVRSWIVHLSETGLESTSINRKIASLRSYFKFLMRQGIVAKNPLTKIKVLKSKKKLPHFVNESDMAEFTNDKVVPETHDDYRNLVVLEMLYGTGMRLSELINLKESDINLRDCTVKVLGKRNKERIIPFASALVKLLEGYRAVRNREVEQKDHTYFLVTGEGKKLYPVLVNRIVKRFLADAKVDKKSPHVLRHTYATHLLNKGAEINAVKDLLGHTSLAATQVYTHNTIEKLKKIFDQAHPKSGR